MLATKILIALVIVVLVALVGVFVMLGRLSSRIGSAASPDASAEAVVSGSFSPAVYGVPPHVVAAIAGAVAAMGEGGYAIRSIKPVGESRGRGAWGFGGVYSNTRPF